ncbi:MAG: thioredoxin family protein [Fibrobacter sp.]|nr:thioredoxin family protein [Fibrobacter sp.]
MIRFKIYFLGAIMLAAILIVGRYSDVLAQTTTSKTDSSNAAVKKTAKTAAKKTETKSDILVTFVELGSVNCIPCKMMQPIMDEVEKKYGKQVNVVFHDVWTSEGKPFGAKYGIRSIPTQIFLDKDGTEYYRHEGFFPKEELVKILAMKGVKL